ncbi:hypothetical protein SAMN04487761_103100 [Lachnospiraceae bacterium C7]|nr:hypothetical protein SAMN04487761_103100 [Lachnospiraceae bacterium C7]
MNIEKIFLNMIPIILGFMTVLFFTISYFGLKKSKEKVERCNMTTQGYIINWLYEEKDYYSEEEYFQNRDEWYPVIEYCANGQTYRNKENISFRYKGDINVPVKVFYNPYDPMDFYVHMEETKYTYKILRMVSLILAFATGVSIFLIPYISENMTPSV